VSAVRVPQALKPMLRAVADRVLPSRRERRARDEYRRNVTALLGDAVLSGRSPACAFCRRPTRPVSPYILGSYEAELHNDIESVNRSLARRCKRPSQWRRGPRSYHRRADFLRADDLVAHQAAFLATARDASSTYSILLLSQIFGTRE
jgi:hypothetical protein